MNREASASTNDSGVGVAILSGLSPNAFATSAETMSLFGNEPNEPEFGKSSSRQEEDRLCLVQKEDNHYNGGYCIGLDPAQPKTESEPETIPEVALEPTPLRKDPAELPPDAASENEPAMSRLTAYLLSRLISRPDVITVECLSVPENPTGIVKLQPTERSTTWSSLDRQTSSSIAQDRPARQDPEFEPPQAKQSSESQSRYFGTPFSARERKQG